MDELDKDKFWILLPFDDKDVRYKSRKEAQEALISFGDGGYILKSVAYVGKPEIRDIR